MKYWIIPFIALSIVGCTDNGKPESTEQEFDSEEVKSLPLNQRIRRHVQNDLGLTAADKYELETYEKDLNGDDLPDLVITVNLLDRALNEANKSGRPDKAAELGYMGYYNYVFFMDGLSEEISDGVVVPSSPMYELKVDFVKILGTSNTDFTIDYRVRNMQRRKFFTVRSGKPIEVCQAVIFDGLGTPNTEAYDIRYEKGTVNNYNDIVEYEAKLEEIIIPNLDSTYYYEPIVTPTDKEIRRWHFSPTQYKYYIIQN